MGQASSRGSNVPALEVYTFLVEGIKGFYSIITIVR